MVKARNLHDRWASRDLEGVWLHSRASPGFAPELRWRPFPEFSDGFLSVDKSVVRPIAHSRRGRWRLSTWHAVRTGVGAGRRSRYSAPIPREPPRMRQCVCKSAFQPYRDLAALPPGDRLGSLAGPREPSAFAGNATCSGARHCSSGVARVGDQRGDLAHDLEGSGFELPVPHCALIANSAALVAPPDSAVRGGSLNGRLQPRSVVGRQLLG